ncbi:hypothetical protein LTR04_002255 [Oleoguttula sp. CCFEE 6159]|nr:hypothetical protein LTR04_002255 [Oleoguttula sp. CCFEE 6159]
MMNQAHRVTRRKSTSLAAVNNPSAAAAAVKVASASPLEPTTLSNRRSTASKAGAGSRASHVGSYPSPPSSLPQQTTVPEMYRRSTTTERNGSAVTDGPPLSSMAENEKSVGKGRIRRASEGSKLSKEGKRASNGDLRCEKCGKGYKHSSCLTKHLWEHTPEWAFTSKLLISKHQQVQLLEAASVLVAMNQEGPTPPDSARLRDSDHSSASPAASGSPDPQEDDPSSAGATPPPQDNAASRHGQSKRHSDNSSAYSRSYQSTVFSSESAPNMHNGFSHYRQCSADNRPPTAGTSVAGSYRDEEEQADLAAAVGLLSCSFGTPKSGPTTLQSDVPPVPPLPERFRGLSGTTLTSNTKQPSVQAHSYSSYGVHDKDVAMDDDEDDDEDDFDHRSVHRGRHDEDEDGMFGNMEE